MRRTPTTSPARASPGIDRRRAIAARTSCSATSAIAPRSSRCRSGTRGFLSGRRTLSRRARSRRSALHCDGVITMASTRGALIVGLALAAAACSRPAEPQRWPGGTIVDLSHDYSSETVFWPTADPFRLEKVADGITPQGYYYAANNFATSEHGGTHLDAPVHFAQGHWSVDQIPL